MIDGVYSRYYFLAQSSSTRIIEKLCLRDFHLKSFSPAGKFTASQSLPLLPNSRNSSSITSQSKNAISSHSNWHQHNRRRRRKRKLRILLQLLGSMIPIVCHYCTARFTFDTRFTLIAVVTVTKNTIQFIAKTKQVIFSSKI